MYMYVSVSICLSIYLSIIYVIWWSQGMEGARAAPPAPCVHGPLPIQKGTLENIFKSFGLDCLIMCHIYPTVVRGTNRFFTVVRGALGNTSDPALGTCFLHFEPSLDA